MLRVKEAIVVEGRYDKNTLAQLVDTVILETHGFGIFKDKETAQMLTKIAQARGLIIFTDSDGAGFLIRNHLKGILPGELLKHAYIPDLPGKERRKRQAGAAGLLGVEGMTPAVLEQALRRCGATFLDEGVDLASQRPAPITKTDLYMLGLVGDGSRAARSDLLQRLELPAKLSSNALLPVLNALYSRQDFLTLMGAEAL